MASKRKRLKYYPGIQVPFAILLVAANLITCGTTMFLMYNIHFVPEGKIALLFGAYAMFWIVSVIAQTVASFYLLHRAVGPVFRLTKTMTSVAESGPKGQRVKFRTDDCFHETAQAFNTMMDSIEGQNAQAKAAPS